MATNAPIGGTTSTTAASAAGNGGGSIRLLENNEIRQDLLEYVFGGSAAGTIPQQVG
jgi:hypothetical protein